MIWNKFLIWLGIKKEKPQSVEIKRLTYHKKNE